MGDSNNIKKSNDLDDSRFYEKVKWRSGVDTWDKLLDALNNVSSLWELINAFWFNETPKLQEIRRSVVDLLKKGEDYLSVYKEYANLAVKLIDDWPKWPDGKKIPMFVLDLVYASIIREGWNRDYMDIYWDYINSARNICRNSWNDNMDHLIHEVTRPKK